MGTVHQVFGQLFGNKTFIFVVFNRNALDISYLMKVARLFLKKVRSSLKRLMVIWKMLKGAKNIKNAQAISKQISYYYLNFQSPKGPYRKHLMFLSPLQALTVCLMEGQSYFNKTIFYHLPFQISTDGTLLNRRPIDVLIIPLIITAIMPEINKNHLIQA